jgi:hypothetical protein
MHMAILCSWAFHLPQQLEERTGMLLVTLKSNRNADNYEDGKRQKMPRSFKRAKS